MKTVSIAVFLMLCFCFKKDESAELNVGTNNNKGCAI